MGKSRSAGWIGGTAVLIVAILLAAYFLLYTPRAEDAAATQAMADETVARNDILEIQVADLRAKAENIDEYWQALDAMGAQIPDAAELADFTQVVREAAEQFGVTIVELAPGAPMTVAVPTPVTPTAPTAPPTDGAAPGDTAVDQAEETAGAAEESADAQDDADQPAAPTAPTGPVQIEGFVAVPGMIKVLGPSADTVDFLDHLQTRPGRLFLASDLDATRQKNVAAGQGKPATVDGDLELTINGYIYVLLDIPGATPVPEGEEPTEEPAEPAMPGSPNNPFVPLVPSDAPQTA